MDLKITGKCFIKQGSGLVMDKEGNKLPVNSVLLCKMIPFIIEYGNTDKFKDGKMDAIYQADDQYFDFLKEQVSELQAEMSQSIITNVF